MILILLSRLLQIERHFSNSGATRGSEDEGDTAEYDRSPGNAIIADIKKQWLSTLADRCTDFISTTGKKVYVTRNKNAYADAEEFIKDTIDFKGEGGDGEAEHPIIPKLSLLNPESALSLYIEMGKRKKAGEKGRETNARKRKETSTEGSNVVDSYESEALRPAAKRARELPSSRNMIASSSKRSSTIKFNLDRLLHRLRNRIYLLRNYK